MRNYINTLKKHVKEIHKNKIANNSITQEKPDIDQSIKKKKLKNQLSSNFSSDATTTVSVTRLTYDVWKETYPNSTRAEWSATTRPGHVINFIGNAADVLESSDTQLKNYKIRVATLDDEYLCWLKDNQLENSADSRQQYAQEMSDDEALRLLRKNRDDYVYNIVAFSVICFYSEGLQSTKTQYKLDKQLCNDLKEYLEKIYTKSIVYVPGLVMKPDELYYHADMLINITKPYFEDKVSIKYGKYDEQLYSTKGINATILYIPFVVCEKLDTAVFNPDELYCNIIGKTKIDRTPDMINFTQEFFGLIGLQGIMPIKDTGITKKAEAIFKDATMVYMNTGTTPIRNIPKELKEFERAFLKDKR